MKLPALLLAVTIAHTMVAMDDQAQAKTNPITTLRGTVKRKPHGGCLDCEVTYNSRTGVYSGTEYNNGYSKKEWVSGNLRPDDAQKYYQQLLAAQVAAAQQKK